MARGTTRDLYLQVGGNVDGLRTASKAGKTALLELGAAAVDIQTQVEKAFADMGANAPTSAKALERSYTQTFNAIRENARKALEAPTQGAALQILDAGAADRAATAAEGQAAALRQVAAAAAIVAQRAGEAGEAERVLAVAAAANAQQAENEATALRNQANVLGAVRGELEQMGVAHRGVVVRSEQQRQSTIMLGQQLQDFSVQVVSGQSVATAFAQQIGQAAFAVQGMGGKLEAVGTFLTSGWGIAATVATTVLVPLISKVIEHTDAVGEETDKLKDNAKQAAVADQAKQAFLQTEAGAVDDVRALTEELKKQNDALRTNAERLNIRSKLRLQTLNERRGDVVGDLADARSRRDFELRSTREGSDIRASQAARDVADLEAKLQRIDGEIAKANAARLETQKDLVGEAAARATDPLEQIKRKYEGADGLIEQAKKQATAEETINGTLRRRLTLLAQQQKAETDAAQKRISDAKRTPNNNQIGRTITVAEATQIVAGIGGRVTSGLRSTADQERIYADKLAGRHAGPVAKPGTSDHEKGQAIDIAYGPGISVSSIRQAFAKEGVAIRQLLDEKEQRIYHVAFGPKGKSQESIDRSADAAAQKKIRDEEAYSQLELRAREDALQLRRAQVTDIATAADLDVQAVDIERQRLDSAADAGVAEKRWTQAKADALKVIYASNAQAKVAAIRDTESQRLLDQQLGAEREQLGNASALLQIQGDLATTNAERRRIALALLANDEAQQRAQAVRLIGSNNPDDWTRGEGMLKQIDAEHAGRTEQIDRQYAGPLEQYRQQLKAATEDMDTAMQGVAVHAFQNLEDGLVGLIDGTEDVASAFKKMAGSIIADLARIAIEKAIVNAIPGAGSFFGFSKGGKIEGKATGGRIIGPGSGTSDSIFALIDGVKPLMVSNGESIVTADATARWWPIIDAMNRGTFQLPGLATGGAVGSVSMPALPAPASLQAGASAEPMTITLRLTKGDTFAADVIDVSGPHAFRILQEAAPSMVEASTAATVQRLRSPQL